MTSHFLQLSYSYIFLSYELKEALVEDEAQVTYQREEAAYGGHPVPPDLRSPLPLGIPLMFLRLPRH